MKDGFIRVAAATPDIKVADPVYNEAQVWNMIEEGEKNGAKLMVFPELCLTGYTCGDLFHQDILVDTALGYTYGSYKRMQYALYRLLGCRVRK